MKHKLPYNVRKRSSFNKQALHTVKHNTQHKHLAATKQQY